MVESNTPDLLMQNKSCLMGLVLTISHISLSAKTSAPAKSLFGPVNILVPEKYGKLCHESLLLCCLNKGTRFSGEDIITLSKFLVKGLILKYFTTRTLKSKHYIYYCLGSNN